MSTENHTHADPIDEQHPDQHPDASPVDTSPDILGATVHAARSSPADRGLTGRGMEVAYEQ